MTLVKAIRTDCWGCKRFRATAFVAPPPGQLPEDQTTGETDFEFVGNGLSGPIRQSQQARGKSLFGHFVLQFIERSRPRDRA